MNDERGDDHTVAAETTATMAAAGATTTASKLWVEIATGELLVLQSTPSQCSIFSVQAPERPPTDDMPLQTVLLSSEQCTAAVRLPLAHDEELSSPLLAIALQRSVDTDASSSGVVLAVCSDAGEGAPRVAGRHTEL